MAISRPPKLKTASDFMTKKKYKNSTPEEYYEVTSQKLGLYDPDTAYKGSQREKQEKASEKRMSLPKINLREIQENAIKGDFLSPKETSERNKEYHVDAGYQEKEKKGGLKLPSFISTSQEGKPKATLGVAKTPQLQKASLQANGKTIYNQNQARTNMSGNQIMTDADIKGQKKPEKGITGGEALKSVGRSLKDLPRNLASGALNALETGSELITFGGQSNEYKARTKEDWAKQDTPFNTYEEYLAHIDKLNNDQSKFQEDIAKVGSEVTDDTTLWEKMVKGAAQSAPASFMTAGLGGAGAGIVSGLVANPVVIEGVRTMPLLASGTQSGLKTADEMGLTGGKKYSYAVISGLLEAGTERLSSLGLEGKLLGRKTSGGVGGTQEFLRAIFEEAGSEMLNEVGQQVLTGAYTDFESFEMDFENILVAGGSAALMGGFGAVGELSNGTKYKTVGTEDNMVIVETQDGRRERLSPEIVMRHQLAMNRQAYKSDALLRADAELQELASQMETETKTEAIIPTQEPTRSQVTFEPETEVSTPKEVKPLTEPLNEVETVSEIEQVTPTETTVEPITEIEKPTIDDGKSIKVKDMETRLTAEAKLENMIEKKLIGSDNNRMVAEKLNRQIVESGGKDRSEEFKKVGVPKIKEVEAIMPTKETTSWKANEALAEFTETLSYKDSMLYKQTLSGRNVIGDTTKTRVETIYEQVLEGKKFKKEKNGKRFKYNIVDSNGEYFDFSDEESYNFAKYLEKKLGIKSEVKVPTVKTVKVGEHKGVLDSVEIMYRGKDGKTEYPERQGHKFEIVKGAPILVYNNGTDDVRNDWVVVDYQTGYSFGQAGEFKSRKAAIEGYISGYAKSHEKLLNDGVIAKQAELNNEKKIELSKQNKDGSIYTYEKIKKNEGEVIPQGEYIRKYGAGVDFDRKLTRMEMNKYGLELKSTESAKPIKEKITVKGEDLVANNMAVMDSDGESDVLYDGENDRVFKTRQTKETLMNSEKIDDAMKDRIIADNPNLYETRPQRDVKMEVVSDIQRNGYDNTLKEIMAQNEEGSGFNTDYDQEMLASMMIETQRMRKKNKDNGYYQEQFDKLYKIYSESGTEVARGLAIRKELATTPIGKAIASKGEVEKHRTTEQKEIAGDIDKVVDGIFGDDNLVDAEKAAEAIEKKFKVPKKWIEKLKKDIADENLTKTEVKERLAEQLKVPTLTEAEFDEITEIADELDKLDPKSETYEREAKELTGRMREMVERKNITFWQKVSSVQTMAMLMNVKTTLRNEIGNFLGFGTGQLDDVFSYVFDMPIKALTNKQGTLKPAINPKNYGWWKNTKKSFELLNDQTIDVDGKYQKKRVFVPGSKMAKLEGILAVMLSDSRHKQSRIDMMEEQIKATEQYAKKKGLDFDAEGFRSEMNYYADYNTFNFDSKMAQWLDKMVKETNLKMTPFISNKDFGTGTLLAKFAKTPMNIIQYQLDHIGADLLREGVKTARLSKKYGMKNAIAMNQTRISRSLGKTATGMTYIMLGTLLSNAGAFIDEEEDKNVKALLQANGINGGYFNFSALRRSLSGGESKYQEGDSTVSINWMLPVAPFLLLGSRLAKAKDEQEADTILEGLQSAITAIGSSASDFAELPFNRTLGILTSPYYTGMDKFNQILSGTVTGFVPSPVKQLAQGIDPTSKKYSKNTAVAFGQQIKATLPGLRNTVPNRFDITGETMRFTDNETMVGDIFEMFLNPAYTDTVSDDPTLSAILKAQESGKIHTLPKVSNDYFSYDSERYDMTPEEHQKYQKDYYEAYKKLFKTKKDGAYVDAHTLAAEQAKMKYLRKKKVKFETTESGRLKPPTMSKNK